MAWLLQHHRPRAKADLTQGILPSRGSNGSSWGHNRRACIYLVSLWPGPVSLVITNNLHWPLRSAVSNQTIPKNSLSSRMWIIKELASKWELRWGTRKNPTVNMCNTLFSIFPFLSWSTNYRTEIRMPNQLDQTVTHLKTQDKLCLPASKRTVKIISTGPSGSSPGNWELPRDQCHHQGYSAWAQGGAPNSQWHGRQNQQRD